jgi:RND family efflux transporter MFP subunit
MSNQCKHLLYMVLVALLFLSCGSGEQVEEEAVRPVKYRTVALLGDTQTRAFSGTAQSSSQANLSFRTGGILTTLSVQVGDRVQSGELIAALDTKDAELGVQQARASLENAKVQHNNALSTLERVRQLYEVGNASLSEYEQAKAQAANSESQLEASQKNLELKQSQLSYHTISSPAAGVISQVTAEVNEVIQAGSPVVTLNSGEGIEIEVGVPEAYIAQIEQGERITINFSSLADSTFEGAITEVSVTAGESGTYPVTVAVDNASAKIRSGMAAEVAFSFAKKGQKNQLVVPMGAVDRQGDSSYVFVLSQSQNAYEAKKTSVELGPLTESGFVVRSGVQTGDLVASAGISSLYDGRRVMLLNNQ